MALRLKLGRPIEKDARRLLLEQIERAETELSAGGAGAGAVHETRKCMKRIRSLLRLLRAGLKTSVFKTEDDRYRSIGRLLSQLRDRHVLLQVLANLEADSDAVTREALVASRVAFAPKALNGSGSSDDQDAVITEALQRLDEGRTAANGLKLSPARIETLAKGLARNYADGKRHFKAQRKSPSDEGMHELRKTIQHHWRHLQILSPAWPELYEARIATAKTLAAMLGTDHDLSVLVSEVGALAPRSLSEPQKAAVIARAREEQERIRRDYVPLAWRLFAESPAEVESTTTRLWKVARRARALERAASATARAKPVPSEAGPKVRSGSPTEA